MSANKPKNETILSRVAVMGVMAVLFAIPLFLHLDSKPLREWDEARNAVNAFEMSRSGELLMKTYLNEPDLWETKPPLLVWMQAAGFRLFGYGELAVRLPSALSGLLLAFFMVWWFYRASGSLLPGFLSAMVLLSSNGFIHEHAARTGDHDALLSCLATMMMLSFFSYAEHRKKTDLILFSASLALGIYAKSVSILMLGPGIFTWMLTGRKSRALLKDGKLWTGVAVALALAALYYLLREYRRPGYLLSVWHNELFPRYTNSSDRYQYEQGDLWFYFRQLRDWQFTYWKYLLLPAAVFTLISCRGVCRRFQIYLLCNIVFFFWVISAGTSNVWYDIPLLPMLAMLCGTALHHAAGLLSEKLKLSQRIRAAAGIVVFISLFYSPYRHVTEKVLSHDETSAQVMYGYAFQKLEKEYPEIKDLYVYDPLNYNYPLVYYTGVYNTLKQYRIEALYPPDLAQKKGYILLLEEQFPGFEKKGIAWDTVLKEPMYRVVRTY